MVTSHITTVQYQNQETDISTMYVYSSMSFYHMDEFL